MYKKSVFTVISFILFSYLSGMDSQDDFTTRAILSLDSFIVECSPTVTSCTKTGVLNAQDVLHIESQQRVGINLHDKTLYKDNTFDGCPFVCYRGKVAYSGNKCLGIFCSSDKEYKLPLSEDTEKNDRIKSISFNEEGDRIVAVSSKKMFMFAMIKENPELITQGTFNDMDPIVKTFHSTALNNTGKILAACIESTSKTTGAKHLQVDIVDVSENKVTDLLYVIDLNLVYPEMLYFVQDHKLICAYAENRKEYNLKKGQEIIASLTPEQIIALQSIHRQQQQMLEDNNARGIYTFGTKVHIDKDNQYHTTVTNLPKIVKKWVKKIAFIQGEEGWGM